MGFPWNLLPSALKAGRYDRHHFLGDVIAAVIVAIMLIPQSLAYALLAGVPAEVGLYASILPLIAYAILGSSSTLSVGPVAITSLMTAAALSDVAAQGSADYLTAAITLAALSGAMLLGFGTLRFGILANFLSHTVVQAFITASAIIIAVSQFKHLMGVNSGGDNLLELLSALIENVGQTNIYTFALGLAVIVFLLSSRCWGVGFLGRFGIATHSADLMVKAAPVLGVIVSILTVVLFDLEAKDVAVVGNIPAGLPSLALPSFNLPLVKELLLPAALISTIGYVESISVGSALGAKRREGVDNNRELVALGGANLAAAVSGAFPVTGGFSRSVVNFNAGAHSQLASLMTAGLIALVALFLTPFLYHLPKAVLAATIIVAVSSLVDFSIIKKTWRFSKRDWGSVVATLFLTLGFGVEVGVSSGVLISIALHLYRTARPHVAEVGLVEGTEHFRNILRYKVKTIPSVLTLRIDESLFFANASMLGKLIYERVAEDKNIVHVILMCSAVNEVDFSALETLEEINQRLREENIFLHLSEVKGPVLDKLRRARFIDQMSGNLYLTQHQAFADLIRKEESKTR
ncbi:MAG: sulfate permease [Gammaproteobacteria bacterium]|jgi:sulfate permease, SulP family|nr:sulfate permease [Gammaproteobacteria bacterium]MBT6480479.1 sulfate permease [Gammaproteobacteria bacterium]MBT7227082.1 sulfate permease [Gammaproteobacteria bacterium]